MTVLFYALLIAGALGLIHSAVLFYELGKNMTYDSSDAITLHHDHSRASNYAVLTSRTAAFMILIIAAALLRFVS